MLDLHEIRKRGGIVLILLVLVMLLYIALVLAAVPTHNTPILNSSSGTDTTSENLTLYNVSTADGDNDNVTNIINWYRNGTSITVLNMPFEADGDQNASDYSGYGNDGTTVNSPVWNATGGHNGTGAFVFDGTNNITIADSASLDLTDQISIELWVNSSNWTLDNDSCFSLVEKLTGGSNGYLLFACRDDSESNNHLRFTADDDWDAVGYNMTNLNENQWYHVVAIYNGTNQTLYVNGEFVAGRNQTGTMTSNNENLTIAGGMDGPFEGMIDELRIYNISLTAQQIQILYENRTDLIHNNETTTGEVWNATITPNDGTGDGLTKWSNTLTIVAAANSVPTHGTPILNSSLGTNSTTENLTIYNISTADTNNDNITNIINWYKDGESITILNVPFEADGDNNAHDYSGYGNNATSIVSVWNSTGGYDGKGAFEFDGSTTTIKFGTGPIDLIDLSNEWTVLGYGMPAGTSGMTCAFGFTNPSDSNQRISIGHNNGDIKIISNGETPGQGTTLVVGNYYQLGMSFDGTNLTAYLNGQPNYEFTPSSFNWQSATEFWVGYHNSDAYWDGALDNVMIFNHSLSDAQIEAIYNNLTNTIVSQETDFGEVWNATLTPNDGTADGLTKWSNTLTIAAIPNSVPTHGTPILNSSSGTDTTSENLTVYNVSTIDANGDNITNIINWYRNGTSITQFNFPMEGGSLNGTAGGVNDAVMDHSGNSNNASSVRALWYKNSGYDGNGAYYFDGDGDYLTISDSASLDSESMTLTFWVNTTDTGDNGNWFDSKVLFERDQAGGGNAGWAVALANGNASINWVAVDDSLLSITDIGDGEWHHVALVKTTTTKSIYIDGVLDASEADTGSIVNNEMIYVGCEAVSDYFTGWLDEIVAYNIALSPEQIEALYNNRTDLIVSNETVLGETWNATITPNDGTADGLTKWSNALTILPDPTAPTQGTPILNSSSGTNTTSENITVYNISTEDVNGDSIKNIINWYRNDTSITLLNMPFEADNASNASDYSGFGNNISGFQGAPTWNATGGHDGKGAFLFDGDDCIVTALDLIPISQPDLTICGWAYPTTEGYLREFVGTDQGGWDLAISTVSGFWVLADGTQYWASTVPVYTNSWQHICAVWETGNQLIYLNGSLGQSRGSGSSHDDTDYNLSIGCNPSFGQYWKGLIDDVMIFNESLTAAQIEALYSGTDTIVSAQLNKGDTWNATITANDGKTDGWKNWSNSLLILNSPPTQGTPILNSTFDTNSTNENITVYNVSTTDIDGDSIKNIYNWYLDGESYTVLNMPFEADGDQNATDYSSYGNDGTATNGVVWNATAGYDGKGAYEFDGDDDYIDVGTLGNFGSWMNQFTISMWIKTDTTGDWSTLFKTVNDGSTTLIGVDLNRKNDYTYENATTLFDIRGQGITNLRGTINVSTLYDNTWHHLVWRMINASNNTFEVYVDGVNKTVTLGASDSPVYVNLQYPLSIGAGNNRGSLERYYNGSIDDIMIFNSTLSPEQITALYNNRTDLMVSDETESGDVWNATITPNDGTNDGTAIWSNRVTILSNAVPLHSTPILNASTVFNTSTSNLTIFNQTTRDGDNDGIKNIINWYLDGNSIALVNAPFEGGSNDTFAKDYSGNENNASLFGGDPTWSSTGGHDSKGAYVLDGGGDCLGFGSGHSNFQTTDSFAISTWFKTNDAAGTIIGKWDLSVTAGYLIDTGTGNYIYFGMYDSGGSNSIRARGSTGVTDNVWRHLVVSYNGSDDAAGIQIYLNGSLESMVEISETDPGTLGDSTLTAGCRKANNHELASTIDDIMIFNRSLSPEQVLALYNNRTDIIHHNETSGGEVWNATLTPNDGTTDGETLWSNTVAVVADGIPVHTIPILNSTSGNNYTTENITIYNQSTEDEESPVKNIINWYRNGTSITVLNMPFEGGSNNTFAKDYSPFQNNGTVDTLSWNSKGGYDGNGAFMFNGGNVTIADDASLDLTNQISIEVWLKSFNWTLDDDECFAVVEKYLGGDNGYLMYACREDAETKNHLQFNADDDWTAVSYNMSNLNENKWYHVVGVYNGTNQTLYINGQLVAGVNQTGAMTPNNDPLIIGGGGDGPFNGIIDDLRIYNISLTAEQIEALYNNRTDIIDDSINFYDETWNATITPNDGTQDGNTLWSNSLTIVGDCTDADGDSINASAEGCGPADCNDGDATVLVPYAGYAINDNVTFCPGTYSVGSATTWINTGGVTVTCNGTTIVGDSSQTIFSVNYNKEDITIDGCNFQDYAMAIDWSGSADNLTVRDGVFNDTSNIHIGMSVGDSTGSMLIENNTFEGLYGRSAIQAECINCIFRGNTFYLSRINFRSENTNNLTVENNTFFNTYFDLNSNPKNLTIRYNTFNYSATHAINAQTGDTITIYGNNFSNTQGSNYGISVTGSTTNVIIYDNWFNNTNNARDTSSGNVQWNTTKDLTRTNILGGVATGGNYWNDFTGEDSTGDGISNTPNNYTIDSDSIDYLPLTSNDTSSNGVPTQGTPILNSTFGTNSITENLTVYNISTFDINSDNVTNIINWYKDGTSITVLNMPFEADNASNASDYSGYGNNGTVTDAIWNATGGYDGKGAFMFDGVNNFINLGNDTSLDLTGNFTMGFWMYPFSWSPSSYPGIITKRDTYGGLDWQLFYAKGSVGGCEDELCFWFGSNGANEVLNTLNVNPSLDTWSYIVLTREDSTWTLYLDGVSQGTEADSNAIPTGDSIRIGRLGGDLGEYFNGTIDNLMIFNRSLSPEQVQALYNNRTDLIVSQETSTGDVWNATITTNDGTEDGWSNWSNSLTILANAVPTHGTPILNSSSNTNTSTENLTVYNVSTLDGDNDDVKNIINWYKDGTSLTVLNIPFEADGSDNASDYSDFGNDGTVTGATWNATGGYDGFGAYKFDGNDGINGSSIGITGDSAASICAWVNYDGEGDSGYPNIVAFGAHATDQAFVLYRRAEGYPAIGSKGGDYAQGTTNMSASPDDWFYLCGTYSGNEGTYRIYLNGNEEGTGSESGGLNLGNDLFSIGVETDFNSQYWNGSIDEVLIFNHSLSPQQIEALYQNRTDLIVSQEISRGDVWNASITPNDGTADGTTKWSNVLTVLNSLPTHGTPILNSSSGTDTTSENLTIYNSSTYDKDSDNITNIINWYKNGTSIYIVNMPFEPGNNLTDYSDYDNNGSITGTVVYNATGGYDGKGCFEFSGTGGNYITLADTDLDDVFGNGFTWAAWVKHDNQAAGWGWVFDGSSSYAQFGKKSGEGELRFDGISGSLDTVGADVADGNWHHVVATWDGSTKSIYYDGVLNVTGAASESLDSGGNMVIGDHPGNSEAWEGSIDDVLLLNYSLSAEQIFALYQNRTDLIVSQETTLGDVWNATITPNDGTGDGTTKWSNALTIGVGPYPNCDGDTVNGLWTIVNAQTITDHIECEVINITAFGSLIVNSSVNNVSININATNLTIASGGSITANGLGYLMAEGPHAGTDGASFNQAGGGGFGGKGGKGNDNKAGGNPYGSSLNPTDLGSGGGYGGLAGCEGGSEGGGAIKLIIDDTLILNGTITTNGLVGLTNSTYASGGGSGGSIWINTTVFWGSGNLSAVGGTAGNAGGVSGSAGGGAGGRVVVYYNTTSINITDSNVSGGWALSSAQKGDPGTLGFIDKDDNNIEIYQGFEFQEDASYENITIFNSTIIINGSVELNATNIIKNTTWLNFTCYNTGYNFTLNVDNDLNLSNSNIKNLGLFGTDCNDIIIYSGADLFADNLTIEAGGVVTLNRTTSTSVTYNTLSITSANNITLDVTSNYLTLNSSTLSQSNEKNWIYIENASTLILQSTILTGNVNWSLINLSIDAASSIVADDKGNIPGQGIGAGGAGATWKGGGGGAFGGDGGSGSNDGWNAPSVQGGNAWDGIISPIEFGSGGGICGHADCNSVGGSGGGIIYLTISDTFDFYGTFSSNGEMGAGRNSGAYPGGGGSGGSIFINATNINATGNLSIEGGQGSDEQRCGGGGGGGRIAIYYGTILNTFSLTNISIVGGPVGCAFGSGQTAGDDGSVFISQTNTTTSTPLDDSYLLTTTGAIDVRTNYSINATNQINKTIITTWSSSELVWNDSASNSATMAWYNVTGLDASSDYNISDNGAEIPVSPLTTDGSGNLPVFNITLSSEHEINVSLFNLNCYDMAIDPIPLCTCADFNLTRDNLSANYQLQNNINCSVTSSWNSAAGFNPIGNSGSRFSGTFDGQNYNVTDVFINRSTTDNVGVFGYTDTGSTISNLGVVDVNITGDQDIGGLVGFSRGPINNSFSTGVISCTSGCGGLVGEFREAIALNNSYSSVDVTASGGTVGGLVGYAYGSPSITIENSYSTGIVTGDGFIGGIIGSSASLIVLNSWSSSNVISTDLPTGGLAGFPNGGEWRNCYATGNISSTASRTGGAFGSWSGTITIDKCYSTGHVTGTGTIGGFAGDSEGTGIITNCYSTSNITATGSGTAAFLGEQDYSTSITNCYATGTISGGSTPGGLVDNLNSGSCSNSFWDEDTTGQSSSRACSIGGKTTAEMKNVSTFTDTDTVGLSSPWDFAYDPNDDVATNDIWQINDTENDGYPYLIASGNDLSGPLMAFSSTTPADNAAVSTSSVEINVSINETSLGKILHDWNGTNYTIFNDSLVLMYNFDNVSALGENDSYIVDMTGNGNNGTFSVTPDVDSGYDPNGKYYGAFEFDASGDYIDCGNDASLRLTDPMTISLWFNWDGSSSNAYILSKGTAGSGQDGYHIWLDLTLGDYLLTTQIGGRMNKYDEPTKNVWHHIVIVDDGTNKITYYDGGFLGSAATDPDDDINDNLIIGAYSVGQSNVFDGHIDEVRIWNISFTADEVYELYASNLRKIDADSWELYVNQSKNATADLDEGIYNYAVHGFDTTNNIRTLQQNITIDKTKPTITNISNQTYEYGPTFTFDINATDNIGVNCFSVNDTNFSIDCDGILQNDTSLALKLFYLNITVNDTAGNENSSFMSVNVTDTTAPVFTNISNTSVYDLDLFTYDINATDAHGVQCFTVNDTTNFQINCTGYLENKTTLSADLYSLNITINDSSGNENWSVMTVNVSKKPVLGISLVTPTTLAVNVSQNQIFQVRATITCNRTDCGEINATLEAFFGNASDIDVAFACDWSGCTDADDLTNYLGGEGFQLTENHDGGWTDAALNSTAFDVVVCGGYYWYGGCDNNFDSPSDAARDAYENEQIPVLSVSMYATAPNYLGITNSVGSYDSSENNILNISNHNIMTGFSGTTPIDLTSDYIGYLSTSQMVDPYTKLFAHEDGGGDEISGFALDAGQATVGTNPNRFVHLGFNVYDTYPTATGNDSQIIKQATCWAATGSYDCAYQQQITNDTTAIPFYSTAINPSNFTLNENESITITWTVNATGAINETYVFVVNTSKTADSLIFNSTNTWNVSISEGTTGPTVTLLSPPNANFTNLNNVTFICNATDNMNVTNISLYHNISQAFALNQTQLTSGTEVQGQFNVTNIADGNYTWNCQANDDLNTTAFATNNTFVVDTIEPTLSLVITSTTLEYMLDDTIIDWGASDINLDTKYINITYPNGTLLTNSTNDTANITLDPMLDLTEVGSYQVTVFANDSATNTNTNISSILVQDSMPPDVMQLSPMAPVSLNTRNVTFDCDASDMHLVTNVSFYHNISQPFGINQSVITSSMAVTESFNLTNIPDGSYVTSCYAADYSNNSMFDLMGNNTLQIDATNPTISIGLSTSTPEFGVDNVVIDWNVTDAHIQYKYMNVTYPNGTFLTNSTNDALDMTLNPAVLNVLGNYTITVKANDTFSNNQTSFTIFTVQDTGGLVTRLESPPNNNYTNINNVTFICNATDNMNATNISLYHNISQIFGINQTVNTSGTAVQAQFNVTNIADGNYTWNCLAYDSSNYTDFAGNRTITVDTIAPNITLITPENESEWNTSSTVTFTYNVTDALSPITNCSLYVNESYMQDNDSISSTQNTFQQQLGDGNYTWFVYCLDQSGNSQNSSTYNLSVLVPYGSLNVSWITPIANINVNHNEFFLMTVNVSCEGGDCGNVTITLDPEPINETNETEEQEINETITEEINQTINETEQENNETIEVDEDLDDITEEIDFEFFTTQTEYTLGETVYFYILPTNATYTINITPTTGTLHDLEFLPTQTGIYNITSTLEYNNQSELFNLTLTVIQETIEEQTNETQAQTYDEGENITQEDKHLGEKLEDEIHFETYFTNITQTNTTLTITFYHDYIQSLPVWIEATEVQYTLSTTNAEPYENTTLEVTLIEGIIPRFNLHLGEESEVFEFGKVIPDVDIDHGETELIDRNDEKLDINITKNNNSINLEGVAEETDIYTYIEPTDQFQTDIIAVEPLEIEQATITLTTDSLITTIFECPDELFNYETLECLEWNQTNITFTQEDNLITFTVNHFSGYAGGNITNNQTSYLTIWDELDQGEPNTTNTKLLNQQTLFFANYLTTQNLTKITNGNCTLNFSGTTYPMTYNSSYTYYTANRSFTTAGTYTYTVTCTHSTNNNLTAQDDIRVPTNKGVVPTTPSTPFYTNGTNPQLCLNLNETNPCTMSWWVNATGTPGLSYEFYAYAISTSYPDDVDEVNSSFLNITIRSNETTEPIIITTNSTPIIAYLGQDISLSATASDNTQVDSCYANITLPNSSMVQVYNTCTAQQIYTTNTLGRHNITFIVNDTSSNIIINTDNYFIVYAVLNFTSTLNDSNGSLNTNLQLIHSETQELVRQDDINGTYNQTIPDTIYDLLYRSYGDRLQVRLRQVNLSDETGNSFGLDKLSTPITGYLLTYAIDTNYSFNNATVIIYYDDASFSNEARLRLYKCDNWNFDTQECDGTWVDISSNSTQNTANDYFEYLTTSFSGFSVGQSSSSSSSSGSGGSSTGTWQKIITPAAVEETEECIPDWQCAYWEECKDNLRTRSCSDVNNCNSPVATPHMIEECLDLAQSTITTNIETEPTTTTQPEQEIIVDFKKGEKTDKTKLGYMLLLVLLISYLIYICYKNKPKFDLKSFNLNKKLKLPVFNLPKINLPKSLKQLKKWFYKF